MRKLYNQSKGKIHPSPPPPSSSTTPEHHLSLLPLAIATLAAALSPEDQQVLAYLISSSANTTTFSTGGKPSNKSGAGGASSGGDHPPQFNCNCFRCYTSFWVRWDASPNRKLIHEIIDAYEDELIHTKKNGKNKKERKNKISSSSSSSSSSSFSTCRDSHAPSAVESVVHAPPQSEEKGVDDEDEMSSEKGSVRKIVSFIGERIWGVWGI